MIARQIAKANGLELPKSWEFNSSDLKRFSEGLTGDELTNLIIAGKGWGNLRDYVQYEADHVKKLIGQLEALAPYLSGDMNLALQQIATGPFLRWAEVMSWGVRSKSGEITSLAGSVEKHSEQVRCLREAAQNAGFE